MNNLYLYIFSFLCISFFINNSLFAQVKFSLQWLEQEQKYLISMHPENDWAAPKNITSTAQITIKSPTGQLEITNLNSLIGGVEWQASACFDRPEEAPEWDYVSFGLTTLATKGLTFEEGIAVPLFTFENHYDCSSPIQLVNNLTDSFMPPNSMRGNIGNQITVLGAKGDAYSGIHGSGVADCSQVTGTRETSPLAFEHKTFPNPAINEINLTFYWEGQATFAEILIRNVDSKIVLSQPTYIKAGNNRLLLSTTTLISGLYLPEVQTGEWITTFPAFLITR